MPQVMLGDIVSPSVIKRKGNDDIPFLSMHKVNGLRPNLFSGEADSTAELSKVAKYGQLVTGLHMDEGSIWVQNVVPEGAVSAAYGVYDVDLSRVDPGYLNYALHTRQCIEFYSHSGVGNNMRRCKVPWETLKTMPIRLPSLEEQASSVRLMRSIERLWYKIFDACTNVNFAEHALLEESIKDPESKSIEDIATLTFGRSLPSDKGEGESWVPLCSGASDFGPVFIEPQKEICSPDRVVDPGTVLLSIRDPVGRVNITPEKCAIGRGVVGLTPKQGICETSFLYLSLSAMEGMLYSMAYGIIKSIGAKEVRNIRIDCIPMDQQKNLAVTFDKLEELRKVLENMLIRTVDLQMRVLEERFSVSVVQ